MTTTSERWLVALDIDGTVLHEDGHLSDQVVKAVQAARDAGHWTVSVDDYPDS